VSFQVVIPIETLGALVTLERSILIVNDEIPATGAHYSGWTAVGGIPQVRIGRWWEAPI
jgi:hypothetical protein